MMTVVVDEKAAAETDRKFSVTVLYDGTKKTIEVESHETVKAVLERAIHAFGPLPNPHTLSLFTEGGQELDDSLTVKAAGIKPHELLLLRPSKVKGGVS